MKSYCYLIVTINMFPVYMYPRHDSTLSRPIDTNEDDYTNKTIYKVLSTIEKVKSKTTTELQIKKCTLWDILFHQCSTHKK